MCYRKLYISATCGHALWGAVVLPCSQVASLTATAQETELSCPYRKHHAFHTRVFHTLCRTCQHARQKRLENLASLGATSYNDPSLSWQLESPTQWKGLADMRMRWKEKAMVERRRITSSEEVDPNADASASASAGFGVYGAPPTTTS